MTKEMKKFDKINRAQSKMGIIQENLENLGEIIVMEKIDGANASFMLDGGEIRYFSRNIELTKDKDSLNGFVQWVKDNIDNSKLEENLVYFGEWTNPHKLNYGDNHKTFYLFDVYDEELQDYKKTYDVVDIAKSLDIKHAPIFYNGEFKDMEHINNMVGKSELGEIGEGVVIKFQEFKYKGKLLYLKLVSESFSEVKNTKTKKNSYSIDELVLGAVNSTRAEKTLRKLVDDGLLKLEDIKIENMGNILKLVSPIIKDDILEEEMVNFKKVIEKKIYRNAPKSIKEAIYTIEKDLTEK